jgi:hypothetical protein
MGEHTLIDILAAIHESPQSLQSNFCRTHSHSVARLASLGLITTAIKGTYGSKWRLTFKGLRVLELGNDQ